MISTVIVGSFICLGVNVRANDAPDAEYEENDATLFDRLYFGLGIGLTFDKDRATYKNTGENGSEEGNSFNGNLYLGKGKVMNGAPVYLGGELGLGFSKAKSKKIHLNGAEVKLNRSGLTPSAGFRVGYVNEGMLFFTKVGISHVKVKIECPETRLSVSKLAPTIGLGAEKMIGSKYSTRLDVEYILKTDSSDSSYKLERKGTVGAKIAIIYNAAF